MCCHARQAAALKAAAIPRLQQADRQGNAGHSVCIRGTSAADAEPWIRVLCQEPHARMYRAAHSRCHEFLEFQ